MRDPVLPPQEPEPVLARPCDDCDDDCGGLVVEPLPPQLPPLAPAPRPPPPPPPLPPPPPPPPPPKPCNCRAGPRSCPLRGRCLIDGENCVYSCTVTRTDVNTSESYGGVARCFKNRWYGHRASERNPEKMKNTKLSGYIWSLKLSNPAIPYTLDWKIIDRGRIFNPVTKVCRLCLKEKWHIMHNPDACSLNSRTEIFNSFPHKRWFTFQYASL